VLLEELCCASVRNIPPTMKAEWYRRENVSLQCVVTTLAIALVLLVSVSVSTAETRDYGGYRPHYQGYGTDTRGGRGGTVCRVTSLSDASWPARRDTLRYCLETAKGPRFVIFEISGTISLEQGPLVVTNPYLTIAGQTAPSPGILIRGPGLVIDTHDVVVQHVRIRVGNVPHEPVGLWFRDDADKVVVDHVSVSWSIWTAVTASAFHAGHPVGEVTVIDSIVAEALGCSGVNSSAPCEVRTYPQKGWANSRGISIGDAWGHAQPKVTLLRNISANNNDRHPEISGGTRTIIVNNLIYNPSQTPLSSIYYQDAGKMGPHLSVVVGNVLIPGPTTPGHNGYVAREYREEGEVRLVRVHPTVSASSRIYLEGNYYADHCVGKGCLASPQAQWMLAKDYKLEWEGVNVRASSPPLELKNLPLSSALPYTEVERYVTANAGARPLDRDAVDSRIIREISLRRGSVPNQTSDKAGVGTSPDGFPILAQQKRKLTVPTKTDAVIDSVGRTRIEAWLEDFARTLEPAQQTATAATTTRPAESSGR
jgi:hypothetical protein